MVEIETVSFLYFVLTLVDAPCRNAAHEYLRTRPIPAHRQAGRLARDILDPVRAELAELGTAQRADAGGHVLNRLGALPRRYDDLVAIIGRGALDARLLCAEIGRAHV